MRIYETVPDEVDEVIPFRNEIFGYISRDQWEAMGCTAVTAREDDGRLVGFIPLQFRRQCLNDRVTIPVVYENAVGVAEDKRGQGIGTQMMDVAAEFIADRADAMFVIRGWEQSIAYRFYRRAGHGDLMYARTYSAPLCGYTGGDASGLLVLDPEEWIALEPQLLSLYAKKYGRYGGGRLREPGYWSAILAAHVYRERDWRLIVLRKESDPQVIRGYLVAVIGGSWRPSEDVQVFEVVGEDERAVRRLIGFAAERAALASAGAPADADERRIVFPYLSLANPVRSVLEAMDFVPEQSTPQVMARILRPDRIWATLAGGSDLLGSLSLTVSTPHRTLEISDPPDARYSVGLQTKESLLARLFCCRLDLEAALDMELVRWNGNDAGIRRELCRILAFSEWVQWFTDFV
jgi:GNAT superfamily N-acetyltransferase